MAVLQPQKIEVRCEGPLVVLQIGNSEIKMEHTTAIQLSTWLRVKGKKAKLIAGDRSSHWSVIGNLQAALAGERPMK
jgi:hypothetical protein